MGPPTLTAELVRQAVPEATEVSSLGAGGQKAVFRAVIEGAAYALKFIKVTAPGYDEEAAEVLTARVKREVETLDQCRTPHLVRLGPIGLRAITIAGEPLMFFSEEFIEGPDLAAFLEAHGPMPPDELVRLAWEMAEAIEALWNLQKVHRDVKPANVMRRAADGSFVLLDMGFVFDHRDESLSRGPVGTPIYFSPEQIDFANRRSLDFRSDLFSLGLVLYEMAIGKHPFVPGARTSWDVVSRIKNDDPVPPVSRRADLPLPLSELIMKLLAKRPALRFRTIDRFRRALLATGLRGGR